MTFPWDETADVAVVGFGAAGVAAALCAADAGARVLVLEKQAAHAHTPSAKAAGGYVMGVHDVEAASTYLHACAGGLTPASVCRAWAEQAGSLHDWLLSEAGELSWSEPTTMHGRAAHPNLPGAASVWTRLYQVPGGGPRHGAELFAALSDALSRRSTAAIRWRHAGRRLLKDSAGRVVGVEVDTPEGVRRIRARSGVILTTGGFEFDEDLKRQYLKAAPMHFAGNPANTGDGLRMALAAGADLWHMNGAAGRQTGHFPYGDGWLNFQMAINPPGYVVLDRYGNRFCDEQRYTEIHTLWYEMLAFDAERREYSRIPSYWVFDTRRFAAGPLTPAGIGRIALGHYDWSPDNGKELAQGWITSGDTVEEAVAAAGVLDPSAAAASVAAFNDGCALGEDPFGRAAPSLVPLDCPPYYCVPLYPGGVSTMGGPRHDEYGRVLDPFGGPIPGLFSAGTVGQMIGMLYPSAGAGWSEALCAGRLAGTSAAAHPA